MRVHLIAMTAAFAASAIAAPSTDPLHSDGCVSAMSALHDVEDAVAASAKSSKGNSPADSRILSKLAELKRIAARTCLGSDGAPARAPQHVGQQPISVAPTAVSPKPSEPRLPVLPPTLLPPVSAAPLKSITSCDAVGCWVNDGTRLQRVGPGLLGPKGFCTVQGSVLNCPP
jgi:hypothetical protein